MIRHRWHWKTLAILGCLTVQAYAQVARMPEDVAVFAIDQQENAAILVPIVVVHYGADQQFKVVPALEKVIGTSSGDEDVEVFKQKFYQPGSEVSLFLGGQKTGSASIR